MNIGEGQEKSYLHLTYQFINRCLNVNRNSEDGQDGIGIMNFMIALLENMQGLIDNDLPHLINIIVEELKFLQDKKKLKNYKSMTL